MDMNETVDRLVKDMRALRFKAPVSHVYNPLQYARAQWDMYVGKYGHGRREVILLGMNPGPWGMVQTGVPFGDVKMVRDWLQIYQETPPPEEQHPNRPITGFSCPPLEVSGSRLWGWARERFETPEKFFSRFFVANYCPLAFMESSGRNRTPDNLPADEKEPLFAACDRALRKMVRIMEPEWVVGVGKFAAKRASEALSGLRVAVGSVTHPSPANPAANRGWAAVAERELSQMGIRLD